MKKIYLKLFILLLLVINMLSLNIYAETRADIGNFMNYLGSMKSFAVDFTQNDTKNNYASGTLLVQKPHNFRCNYYPPFPTVIVGNAQNISMYDYDMETLSRASAGENPFNFLLMEHTDIAQHFDSTIIEDNTNRMIVKLHHRASGKNSEVIVDKLSNQLKTLTIFEPNNTITINFNNFRVVNSFGSDLFKMQTPGLDQVPPRLSKQELQNKIN